MISHSAASLSETSAVEQTATDRDELTTVVAQALTNHLGLLPASGTAPTPLVAAVSGGADSVCLLHALVSLAQEFRLALHVAHFDHGLRTESAGEARFVGDLAEHFGLPFHLAHAAEDLSTAARRARYRFLAQVAENVKGRQQVPPVVTAHHADDQVETMVLNLVRGSGLQGLSAMRPLVELRLHEGSAGDSLTPTVRIFRPLLQISRTAILAYLQTRGLTWCIDTSNIDPALSRNRIRHQVLPELAAINPRAVETMARTAQLLGDEVERLQMLDADLLARLLVEQAPDVRIVLDLDTLRSLSRPDQRGVLRAALRTLRPGLEGVSLAHVDDLLDRLAPGATGGAGHPLLADLMWSSRGATVHTPAQFSLHRREAPAFAHRHPLLEKGASPLPVVAGSEHQVNGWRLSAYVVPREELPADWSANVDPWRAFLDAAYASRPMLTTPQPGMVFAPLGMDGRHKQVSDLFTDRKIPVPERAGWPLLVDAASGAVLWVCGLQPGHDARVRPETRDVLVLAWTRT